MPRKIDLPRAAGPLCSFDVAINGLRRVFAPSFLLTEA